MARRSKWAGRSAAIGALLGIWTAAGPALAAPREAVDGEVAAWINEHISSVIPGLGEVFLDNEVWRYIFAATTLVAVVLLRRVLMRMVMRTLKTITSRTRTELDDQLVSALNPPLGYFLAFAGLYLASRWLILEASIDEGVWSLLRLAGIFCAGWALLRSTSLITALFGNLAKRTESELDDHLVPLMGRIARVVIALMVIVLLIQELGFDVTGLLTGLGVGGLAFALAAKDTLANWFGALMIYTDRPFDVGDWVKTPSLEGVVEEIGLRSTRIRTFAKTVISVPNSTLANEVVENFSRMPKRRVYFNLGVTYATSPAMMREAVARIEDILRGHAEVDQSFWLVKFTDFGDSALKIMLYYFTDTTDWARYLQIRGDINLMIMDALAELGVGIAFPSQSVYLEQVDREELRRLDARARELHSARVKVNDHHDLAVAPANGLGEG
ncbi:MAG: mechanosensitive ion channel family protein [Myxococcales bacterium]|nr:mechanosensitive ion channel family protein [Myxococcales bacterium]